ncbi:MAG: TonB-dependent receptor [Bacteroidetes bacterium]|nr:TonB-dependent receptor [Bacteroidota bacterium]
MIPFNRFVTLCLVLMLCVSHVQAQGPVMLKGSVVDAETESPIPYATVLIHSSNTNKVLLGTVTNDEGFFSIQSDSVRIYAVVSFMGYLNDTLKSNPLMIQKEMLLGVSKLNRSSQDLDAAVVRAEKSTVEFKLDKRVFNVGKDIVSTGAGALDVLANVPSVTVNIEGQVSLRGNSGVKILINGKPSVLTDEGSNALGSITADMIERIEVITNPSAKYEAGGTAGIINIVLKKEEKKGFNGSASLNTGVPANHSIGVSLNRRTEKFNFFTQFGAGYRSLPRYNESENINRGTGSRLMSDGTEYRNENFYNITLGTDYHINDFNVVTLSGNYAFEDEDQPSETTFELYDAGNELVSSWLRSESTQAGNPKWQYDLQYKKQFKNHEDHVLLFSTLGSFFGKEQSSLFNNTAIAGTEVDPNQKTETNFYQTDYTWKLDYTNPINKKITIEAGSQYDINDVGNDYAVYNRVSEDWQADSGLTNTFEYDQKVLGVYATGSFEGSKWGIKLGLRAENTDLKTYLVNTGERNNRNYTNFFPSVHSSYKFNKSVSMQVGYSRRINRPRLWDLNPFFNIRNNYNIRRGNPDLQPEYSNSYELTAIFVRPKFSLNTGVYHLHTIGVMERISIFEDNVNIYMPMNIGTNRKTGLEINGKYSPSRLVTINGDINAGYFVRKGTFEEQKIDFTSRQLTSKLTTKFKLPYSFDLELSGNYESGYQTVQRQVRGFVFGNAGIRKKLWDGKGIVDFGVRDIFASRIDRNLLDNADNYQYSYSRRGRFMTLGFSYSFGKGEAMTYSGRRHH